MKTFDKLSPDLQKKAVEKRLVQLLELALEGFPFDSFKRKIKAACEKANQMQTPWFASEYIMDTCGDFFRANALEDAKEAIYPEPGELVIRL